MPQELFNIELSHQTLRQTLKKQSSANYKLKNIYEFLKLIIDNDNQNEHKYESYFVELKPDLFKLAFENDFKFIDPEFIRNISSKISEMQKLSCFENEKEEFAKLINHLNKVYETRLDELQSGQINTDSETDAVSIVLLENNSDNKLETALIQRLNLRTSYRLKGIDKDIIEFLNITDESDKSIKDQLETDVRIAKSECKKLGVVAGHYNFTYWFDEGNYIYTGASLGIGAICLAYNSLLEKELYKYYYRFYSNTVFTSEISKDGKLLKMEPEVLREKLSGVFFSRNRKFVIPEDNLIEAKEYLKILNDKYPSRLLELIPVKTFTTVFRNLDIVERCELKTTDKIKFLTKKYQKPINYISAVISFLIVAYFVYKVLIPFMDKNPVMKKYEDDRIAVYNKFDRKLWETDFVLNIRNEKEQVKHKGVTETLILNDLDEDGRNEIITIHPSNVDQFVRRKIFCYESGGELKWEYGSPAHVIDYSGNKFEDNFMYYLLESSDYKLNNKKYFISVGGVYQYFPCQVAVHSSDGKEISTYWNSGTIYQLKVFDIDMDGNEEIICVGVNNKFRCATLLVLDPKVMRGSSPMTDPSGSGIKGTEKYCILFPHTFFTLIGGEGYNWAYSIGLKDSGKVTIGVMDLLKEDLLSPNTPVIKYDFGKDMKAEFIGFSSSFSARYNEMKYDTSYNLPAELNFRSYADSLKRSLRYWDGEKFVSEAVMNKNYIEALKKK